MIVGLTILFFIGFIVMTALVFWIFWMLCDYVILPLIIWLDQTGIILILCTLVAIPFVGFLIYTCYLGGNYVINN